MKITLITILILSVLIYGILSVDTKENDKNKVTVEIENGVNGVVKPSHSNNHKTTNLSDESFYHSLDHDEKLHYWNLCFGNHLKSDGSYEIKAIDVEKQINWYINLMTDLNGKPPAKIQLNAYKRKYSNCNRLNERRDELFDEVQNSPYFDYSTGLSFLRKELNELISTNNVNAAVTLAEDSLFSDNSYNRESAIQYLSSNNDWVNNLNEQLGLVLSLEDSQKYLWHSMQLLSCELNLTDCGASSIMAQYNCESDPDACGMNGYAYYRTTISSYDMKRIQRYMDYFIHERNHN